MTNRPHGAFLHLRRGWGVEQITESQAKLLLQHLVMRSSMTWQELKLASRKALGFEKIPTHQIRDRIPDAVDADSVLSFRLADQGRLVGYRSGRIFHVIWVDFRLELYSH